MNCSLSATVWMEAVTGQVWVGCVLDLDGPRFTLLCSHVLVNCSSPLVFLICKVAITAYL